MTSAVLRLPRRAGVLLHPTSLSGGHGIGDLGPGAIAFLEFLNDAGASLWQILPLGPTGYGFSPYAARSAFAGNPLLISLDLLAGEGWLTEDEVAGLAAADAGPVDFGSVEPAKRDLLRRAYDRFADRRISGRYRSFVTSQARWLDDWSLFAALADAHGGASWSDWDGPLARREPEALAQWAAEHRREVDLHRFVQWQFFEQWERIRVAAAERDIAIVGDIPIFIAHDSADVWAHPDLFFLDDQGRPTVVAGVPPDLFSATGQRWGNPLYRWDRLALDGYAWWVDRMRMTFAQVDLVRIDHFRGFESYWEIPADLPTAEVGRWAPGPGKALFDALGQALGSLPIIVEDLGLITPEVAALRDTLGYPGMKVLQFAFGGGAANPYLPFHYEPNAVVYTGTHDNDTTVGWYRSLGDSEQDYVRRYLGVDGHDIAWDLIRLALASVADTAIVPMQDLLGLGTDTRMNYPGRADGNWSWRLPPDALDSFTAARLRDLITLYGRQQTERSHDG